MIMTRGSNSSGLLGVHDERCKANRRRSKLKDINIILGLGATGILKETPSVMRVPVHKPLSNDKMVNHAFGIMKSGNARKPTKQINTLGDPGNIGINRGRARISNNMHHKGINRGIQRSARIHPHRRKRRKIDLPHVIRGHPTPFERLPATRKNRGSGWDGDRRRGRRWGRRGRRRRRRGRRRSPKPIIKQRQGDNIQPILQSNRGIRSRGVIEHTNTASGNRRGSTMETAALAGRHK
jgi:hypothetical protein